VSTVLVIGSTGSIGRLVVAEALREGYAVRALVRSEAKARTLPSEAEPVVGGLTRPETLRPAVNGVDAIVFTHGSEGDSTALENVDYGGVREVLTAVGGRRARIALMTSIGVTDRTGPYNQGNESPDWKRRSERLVRASGLPYTIVRPGWFDYNDADQHRLVLLQRVRRYAGDSGDGVVARSQIAEILVHSLASDAAERKTFELVAEDGPPSNDLDALLAPLDADPSGGLDAVFDPANMPLAEEPATVQDDVSRLASRADGLR
jgi:uncharacterized protein YbjT (DUF2867 family)